jgi:pilus assembly protein CpaF
MAMKVFYYSVVDPLKRMLEVEGAELRIGRAAHNDLVLNSPFVADEAAVVRRDGDGWEFLALSHQAVHLPARTLYRGDRWRVCGEEALRLPPFTLEFDLPEIVDDTARRLEVIDREAQAFTQEVHAEVLRRMRGEVAERRSGETELRVEQLKRWEDEIARVAGEQGLGRADRGPLVDHLAGLALCGQLVDRITATAGPSGSQPAGLVNRAKGWARLVTANADREKEATATIGHLASTLGLAAGDDVRRQLEVVEREGMTVWRKTQAEVHPDFKRYLAVRHLTKQVKDLIFGYGPLEDLLALPTVSEIMVVDADRIYIEKGGRLENSGRRFLSDEVTEAIIDRIVSLAGRSIDRSRPMVDARLADGSRVNAVIPPIAASGPCLTIRKFPVRRLTIGDLLRFGSLTSAVAAFLEAAVRSRCNIVVSGGTGTGKTSLLNCLSEFIPDHERIVTIEDTVELRLHKSHVVQLETKPANREGAGGYAIRDLVRNALRMRPDRVVVGECRGGEALDMLQAMNTGHDGSLTTIHANSAEDVTLRLEVMVQMAADLPVTSIHRQIATAVDLIVQATRLRDGRRVVSQVAEVAGVDPDTHRAVLRELFRFEPEVDQLRPTGHLPTFMAELMSRGLIDLEAFYP